MLPSCPGSVGGAGAARKPAEIVKRLMPVNIIIAVLFLLVIASVWLLFHRVKQSVAPDHPAPVRQEAPAAPPAPPPAPPQQQPRLRRHPRRRRPPMPRASGARFTSRMARRPPAPSSWAFSPALPRDIATTTSGPDGRFTFPSLQHKTYDLTALLGDDAALMQGIPAAIDLDVQLKPRGLVPIEVIDPFGQPVTNATVTLTPSNELPVAAEVQARLNTEPVLQESGLYSAKLGVPCHYIATATDPAGGSGGPVTFQWGPGPDGAASGYNLSAASLSAPSPIPRGTRLKVCTCF